MPTPDVPLEKLGFLSRAGSCSRLQRGPADPLGARQGRALPRHRRRRGPLLRAGRPLYADAAFREVREVVFALPFTFEHPDYVQILTDMATKLGPALGWSPAEV